MAVGLATLLGLLANPGARAEAATVLLLRPARPAPAATEAVVRLRGELTAAGFRVEVADAPAGADAQAALSGSAAAANVDAVVAIPRDPDRQTAQIRIVDRLTGKTVAGQVPPPARGHRGAEVLAIRALELLRASLLEVELESPPPGRPVSPPPSPASVSPGRLAEPPPVPTAPPPPDQAGGTSARPLPPAAVSHPTATSRPRAREAGRVAAPGGTSVFAVEIGGVVLGSVQGVGPAVLPVVRAETRIGARWLGRLTLAGLGTRARVSSGDDAADVAHALALLELALPFRARRRVQPFLSFGAGGAHLTAESLPRWPYPGKRDSSWAALVDVGAGLRVGLGERLQLAGEVHAQGAYPYPVIRFDDTTLAEEGRPTLLAGLSVVVWL